MPRSTPERDFTFQILDWRPTPHPPHEIGSLFVWLEVQGRRDQFFLSRAEAVHFDMGPNCNANYLRVVKHQGRWYVLPINPKRERNVNFLPPPPAKFPPPASAEGPRPS